MLVATRLYPTALIGKLRSPASFVTCPLNCTSTCKRENSDGDYSLDSHHEPAKGLLYGSMCNSGADVTRNTSKAGPEPHQAVKTVGESDEDVVELCGVCDDRERLRLVGWNAILQY